MPTKGISLFGRRKIFSDAFEITDENIVTELTKAYGVHLRNRSEIKYLYNYYKGKQPVLFRTKKIREDIVNRIVENRANEIVSFKVGYNVGEPIQYVSRTPGATESVQLLNALAIDMNKSSLDKDLVESCMICGIGHRLVMPTVDGIELPTLDSMNTFVAHRTDITETPIMGVVYTVSNYNTPTFYAYTDKFMYTIYNGKIMKKEPHNLADIPVIEYVNNNARMGVFEPVIPLLDAINEFDSNRLDSIEQFVQSLLVILGGTLPDGVTTEDIIERGLMCIPHMGASNQRPDIKLLVQELDQSNSQSLKDDLYQAVLTIVGMPSQSSGNTGDSSNNGAVIIKNGWYGAEARAKEFEATYKKSERKMLKILFRACKLLNMNIDLELSEVDIKFTRRNYEDIATKATVLTQLLGCDKVHPLTAYKFCNGFADAEAEYEMGMRWYNENIARAAEIEKTEPEV